MADVITNFGRAQLAGLALNGGAGPASYFGNVGTGAGTAGVTDTNLFSEVASARIACATSNVTTTVANDTAQYTFTYTATTGVTITNAGVGVTNVNAAANIVQKSDHAGVPLLTNDSIAYTFRKQVQ